MEGIGHLSFLRAPVDQDVGCRLEEGGAFELGLETCPELKQAEMNELGAPEHSPPSVTEIIVFKTMFFKYLLFPRRPPGFDS